MRNRKLSSLCCLLVRKQNSPLVLLKLAASLKRATAEIPSRSYSFHIFSLFLLPNLFPREIIAPCIFQGFEVSILQTTSNNRQKFHPLAMLVTAYCCLCQSPFPAQRGLWGYTPSWHTLSIQRHDAEFFIWLKFSLLLAPMTFSVFLGLCLSSHK